MAGGAPIAEFSYFALVLCGRLAVRSCHAALLPD
jgi:hypothetical protein